MRQARRLPRRRKTLSLLEDARRDHYTATECLLTLFEQAETAQDDRRRYAAAMILSEALHELTLIRKLLQGSKS